MSADRLSALDSRFPMRVLALAAVALGLGGCSWFTDFKQQPKIDPWETAADTIPARGNPQSSVPLGGSYAPGFIYSRAAQIPDVQAMADIKNPVPPDARSLENGRKLFTINCLPCHGEKADGMGPIVKYGFVPINLTLDVTKNRTDGYIFGMIRNGRGLMPTYNRIEEQDRWDIVNYLRGLQGKLGTTVPIGPIAPPGITGSSLPGATDLGPSRPAPYYKRIGSQAGLPFHTAHGSATPGAATAAPGAATSSSDSIASGPRAGAADTTTKGGKP